MSMNKAPRARKSAQKYRCLASIVHREAQQYFRSHQYGMAIRLEEEASDYEEQVMRAEGRARRHMKGATV